MPDFATCLSLQSFASEDIAEINGFIQAAGGDQAAGVEAYLGSLDGDIMGVTERVADALGMTQAAPAFDAETDPRVLNQGPVDPVDNQIADDTIVGPDGMPVRLYHGTNQQFDSFNDGQIFLTNQRSLAMEHALRSGVANARLVEANVQLANPLQVEVANGVDPDIHWLENTSQLLADQEAGGHDSIMIWNPEGNLMVIASQNDQVTQLQDQGRTLYQNQALRNEIGLYSQVEQAVLDLKLPQFDGSKKNPEGRAKGADIWAKLIKEPGVKKEELQWLGLEEWLTTDWEAINPDSKGAFTRDEVVQYIQNNGVRIDEIIADEEPGTQEDDVSLEHDRIWDDPEAWENDVDDMLYDFDADQDETQGIDISMWMRDWLRRNIDLAVDNYHHSLPGDQQAELDELITARAEGFDASERQAAADAILSWLEMETDAIPEAELRAEARDEFEEHANEIAEDNYRANPYEIYELQDHEGETIGDGVYAFGNDDIGWSIRTGDPLLFQNEVAGEIYSLGEAEIQAIQHARENDLLQTGFESDVTKWGEYVMDGQHDSYREIKLSLPEVPGTFMENAHFDDDNLVAWLRVTDRTLAETEPKVIGKVDDVEVTVERRTFDESPEISIYSIVASLNGQNVFHANRRLDTMGVTDVSEVEPLIRQLMTERGDWGDGTGRRFATKDGNIIDLNQATRNNTYFIDEFQSDWHQQGRQHGYEGEGSSKDELSEKIGQAEDAYDEVAMQVWEQVTPATRADEFQDDPGYFTERMLQYLQDGYVRQEEQFAILDALGSKPELEPQVRSLAADHKRAKAELDNFWRKVPQAPFKGDGWISLGIKRALVDAAESGKTAFAWADSNTLVNRWSDRYRTLYETQYDKKMTSLVRKLTGQKPENFTAKGPPRMEEQAFLDKHMVVEGEAGLWHVHAIDGEISPHGFHTEAGAQEWLEREAAAQTNREGYWIIEIDDELRQKILSGSFPLFQDEPTGPRGQIDIPAAGVGNGDTVIRLFETADLSTFLHESAHYFLEVMNELGGPELEGDLAVIRKFVGASEGAGFNTEQHEKFARGFEAYLMEGKAPSLELADAFSMFKAWLTRIYQAISGLDVKLNDEIRGVFDRMLATDDAIQNTRNDLAMRALFAEKPPSMSEADWNTYQRMARRAEEQAEQKLLKRMMDKVTREKKAEFKRERAAVREQAEADINARPEYRLVEALGNGQWLGDETADVPEFRIDRNQLVAEFGTDVLSDLDRSKLGGKRAIYGPEGALPSEVAEFFGFEDAGAMVDALRQAGKRKDAIEAETDRRMDERYGDPFTDGTIEEEALAAVHSEQQAAANVQEVRQLARELGRDPTGMTARVYAARAKDMISRMTVAEASKPQKYLAAERKAAREAEKAFARVSRGGGQQALTEAYQAKERQILNQHLYTAARAVSEEVRKGRDKMMRYRKKSVRKKLEGGYIEQIDTLLERYDFRKRSPGQVERQERLQDFVAQMQAEGRSNQVHVADWLMDAPVQGRHYTRLQVDELRGLFDTIENIDHLGRLKQMLIDKQEKRNLDQIVQSIGNEFNENVKGKAPSRTPTEGEKRRKGVREYLNTTLNADTLLREIDGFKDLGPTWTNIKQKIDQGMGRVVERRMKMAEEFDAIYGRYSGKEQRAMSKKKFNAALGDSFSKWDIISIALNTGNQDNYQRLTNDKVKGSFTPHQVEQALAEMTDKDWQTVQMIWDYIDGFWPEVADLEKRATGLAPSKVSASMQVNAPGSVTGGYYPIKYDSRLSGLTDDFQNRDLAESLMGGAFGKAQTSQGHTKERLATSRQPLLIDLGVAHQHVDQVIYDLELREAVTNSWRILQDSRVRAKFLEKGKAADFEALELWLQDVASGERITANGFWALMRHVRTGFTVSRLAVNLSTALIQPTGLAQSAVVVGKKAVAKGTAEYLANPSRWVREVREASPIMRERMRTFERDIFNVVGDIERGPVTGQWAKFQRDYVIPASFYLMQKVQFYAVDMPTWVAAYNKEIDASGDEAKARVYADTMVKRAQGSGLMSDRGMFERGTLGKGMRQHEAPKMLTALGSYMFAKGNVAYEAVQKTDFKSPVQVMHLAVDLALLFTLEATLYAAVKGFLPDEDHDEPEDWAKWLAQETALSAMATLPGTRELSGAMAGFEGGGIFGSTVNIMAKPVLQAAQGEADRAFVKSLVDMGGMLLHLPGSQAKSAINGLFDEDMGLRDDINAAEVLGLSRPGHGRSIADFIFED